jgi:hypothetical protein
VVIEAGNSGLIHEGLIEEVVGRWLGWHMKRQTKGDSSAISERWLVLEGTAAPTQ